MQAKHSEMWQEYTPVSWNRLRKNPPIPAYVCYTDIGQLINWSGASSCSYWLRRPSLGLILQMLASISFWVDIENGLHRAEYLPGGKLMGE